MIRYPLIDLNLVELKYFPFMISLDKYNGSFNVQGKTKNTNVKAFNMERRINETKRLVKYISCDCKCKFNSTTCNSNHKWNNDKCQCECKKTL